MSGLTGKRFGRLIAVEDSGKRSLSRNIIWECKCDCGNYCLVRTSNLKSGITKSCGCLKKESDKIWRSKTEKKYVEGTYLSQIKETRKLNKNNTSGVKGVIWDKRKEKWFARIGFKGKEIFLGYFANKQDAINARLEAEEKYFKSILDKYSIQ